MVGPVSKQGPVQHNTAANESAPAKQAAQAKPGASVTADPVAAATQASNGDPVRFAHALLKAQGYDEETIARMTPHLLNAVLKNQVGAVDPDAVNALARLGRA